MEDTMDAKELLLQRKNASLLMEDSEIQAASDFCEGYKKFLDAAKTEREAVTEIISVATAKGYTEFDKSKTYKAGDKVYVNVRNKAAMLCVFGSEDIKNGVNIIASHIDSPRIDLKGRPLYEDSEMGYFKTHYYGGIKKYQWLTIPLALHGVIIKKDGTTVNVSYGEGENDPVFCITDLLPHLAQDQMRQTLGDGIKGEQLNVLIGSQCFKDDDASEKVKLNLMKMLNKKYGIVEADFLTAELELVPAYKAKDIGFDRSFVGGYGQDDRVCAYTSLVATLEATAPKRTLVTVFADKEETGSGGNTGLRSQFMEYFIHDIAEVFGANGRHVLSNSKCLSADVNVGFDPNFGDVAEKKNSAYMNYGVVLTKYTGSRGKSGTSDASAEFTGEIARMFDANNIIWQHGELGKVDQGGGGTVAVMIAELDVDVIDVGVPILCMHAPYEISAKLDVYITYKSFVAFANHN